MGHVERHIAEVAARLHDSGQATVTQDQLLAEVFAADPKRRCRDSYRHAWGRMRTRGLFHWAGASGNYRLSAKAYRELGREPPDTPFVVDPAGNM
jgi:hypothetical protein